MCGSFGVSMRELEYLRYWNDCLLAGNVSLCDRRLMMGIPTPLLDA